MEMRRYIGKKIQVPFCEGFEVHQSSLKLSSKLLCVSLKNSSMANEAGSQFYDLVERIMRGSHAIKASDIVNTYKEYPQKVIEEKELMFEEVKNRIQYITHWKLFAGNFLLNPVYEKPESEIIVQKNVEALMFYQSKCQFYPPYTVLCCGAFLHHLVEQDYPPAILGLLDIFMSLLFSKVTIVTTNCILAELYSLGPHYASALREGMKLKLINCHHQRHRVETGIDCLLQMVGRNNFTKYIVATTDENILQELEQIQNTPVIHATGKMITLKSPPDHPQVGEGGKKKRMPLKVDKFQFKRKPQGPNPLSCLKKKKK
ncbi:rRNA-processing protein Fcf1/Utp [Trema orientale]|uniref:rRNA-processing protein Fcf1/Utp n=1 Tax=Trema orientale TaxID=63057 RepID=A0A2P5FYV5_TREOI|nr:rRNA-processing protein Fcf1/Utp [Trema orientale]